MDSKTPLEHLLDEMKFKVCSEQKITVLDTDHQETIIFALNQKIGVGVEYSLDSGIVVIHRAQQDASGLIDKKPLCQPLRLFSQRTDILRAFIEEISGKPKVVSRKNVN